MAKGNTSVPNGITTISLAVQEERNAIHAAYEQAAKSQKTAKAFLISAGILNKRGKLAKSYR